MGSKPHTFLVGLVLAAATIAEAQGPPTINILSPAPGPGPEPAPLYDVQPTITVSYASDPAPRSILPA